MSDPAAAAKPATKQRPMGGPVAVPDELGLFDAPLDAPDVLPYTRALDAEGNSAKAAAKLAPKAGGIRLTILRAVIAHGPCTRKELTRHTGLGMQTVSGGSGVWWLNRNGYTRIDGSRNGEGVVVWTGKHP